MTLEMQYGAMEYAKVPDFRDAVRIPVLNYDHVKMMEIRFQLNKVRISTSAHMAGAFYAYSNKYQTKEAFRKKVASVLGMP